MRITPNKGIETDADFTLFHFHFILSFGAAHAERYA